MALPRDRDHVSALAFMPLVERPVEAGDGSLGHTNRPDEIVALPARHNVVAPRFIFGRLVHEYLRPIQHFIQPQLTDSAIAEGRGAGLSTALTRINN